MTDMFLTAEQLAILTGRKMKSLQIQALRQMGIPFFVNAIGHPVVARVAIEGGKQIAEPPKKKWVSNVMLPGYVRPEGKKKGQGLSLPSFSFPVITKRYISHCHNKADRRIVGR